jgi:hypothetical protein
MSAYRYENLTAVIAKLPELREEIHRVRQWDMNVGREETSEKINAAIGRAKTLQAKAAQATVKTRLKDILKLRMMCAAALLVGTGAMAGAYFAGDLGGAEYLIGGVGPLIAMFGAAGIVGPGGWSNRLSEPSSWDDMKELAEDEDQVATGIGRCLAERDPTLPAQPPAGDGKTRRRRTPPR